VEAHKREITHERKCSLTREKARRSAYVDVETFALSSAKLQERELTREKGFSDKRERVL